MGEQEGGRDPVTTLLVRPPVLVSGLRMVDQRGEGTREGLRPLQILILSDWRLISSVSLCLTSGVTEPDLLPDIPGLWSELELFH